jgi:hypothetical protein
MFASIENFDLWNSNPSVNWIGIPPTPALIAKRKADIDPAKKGQKAIPEIPKDEQLQIEDKTEKLPAAEAGV